MHPQPQAVHGSAYSWSTRKMKMRQQRDGTAKFVQMMARFTPLRCCRCNDEDEIVSSCVRLNL